MGKEMDWKYKLRRGRFMGDWGTQGRALSESWSRKEKFNRKRQSKKSSKRGREWGSRPGDTLGPGLPKKGHLLRILS